MQTWKEIIFCYNISCIQQEFVLFIRNDAGRGERGEGILGGAVVKCARHRVLAFPKTESWPPSSRLWISNKLPGEEHQKKHVLYLAFIFTHRQGSGFCTNSFSCLLICVSSTLTLSWFYPYTVDQLLKIGWGPLSSLETTVLTLYLHRLDSVPLFLKVQSFQTPITTLYHLCGTRISRGCRNWLSCQSYHSRSGCFFCPLGIFVFFFLQMWIQWDQMDRRGAWKKERYSKTALFLNTWQHPFPGNVRQKQTNKRKVFKLSCTMTVLLRVIHAHRVSDCNEKLNQTLIE